MPDHTLLSTGCPEADRQLAKRLDWESKAIGANLCPNGHGMLVTRSEGLRECTTCRFAVYVATRTERRQR